MSEAERFQCVDEYDIKVARDAAMLERIVENNHFCTKLADRHPRGGYAVGVLPVGHTGKLLFEFAGFVVLRTAHGFVSAADQRDLEAVVLEPTGQPLDHGGFAGAAEG